MSIISVVTDSYASFMVNGKQTTVYNDQPGYKEVIIALAKKDEKFLSDFAENPSIMKAKIYEVIFGDNVSVDDDGNVFVNGKPIAKQIGDRIKAHIELGISPVPIINFLAKLDQNPSARARIELFDFLENKNLPLDDEGFFYAYKTVGPDYWSKRGGNLVLTSGVTDDKGRILNSVGAVITCDRSEVDDARENTCSFGLHAGGLTYVTKTYYKHGDKILIVKINPKDVVAVPKDYNAQKLRTASYEVISEYTGPLPDYTLNPSDSYDYGYEDEEYYDDYFDSPVSCNDVEVGDLISFNVGLTRFEDIEVLKIVGNMIYGANLSGFGAWSLSEMESLVIE